MRLVFLLLFFTTILAQAQFGIVSPASGSPITQGQDFNLVVRVFGSKAVGSVAVNVTLSNDRSGNSQYFGQFLTSKYRTPGDTTTVTLPLTSPGPYFGLGLTIVTVHDIVGTDNANGSYSVDYNVQPTYYSNVTVVPGSAEYQCLSNCSSTYPYTYDRPEPCCGCCNSGESCHETTLLSVCCPTSGSFCGCLSSRAFCSGSIYNSTARPNTFGTCYDPSNPETAVCGYNPGPNVWVLCPTAYTPCISPSILPATCCAPGFACNSSAYGDQPLCYPVDSASVTSTPATSAPACTEVAVVPIASCTNSNPARDPTCCLGDGYGVSNGSFCGTRHQCFNGFCGLTGKDGENCPYTVPTTSSPSAPPRTSVAAPSATDSSVPTQGEFLAPTPAAGATLVAGQRYTFSYRSPTSPPGNVFILNLGPSVLADGAFSSNPLTVTATVPTALPSGPANLTFLEEHNNLGPFAAYNTATVRLYNIYNAADATGTSVTTQPQQNNCPASLKACGDACYIEEEYCCPNGQLIQKQFCSSNTATPTATQTTPTVSQTPPPQPSRCPAPLKSCGDACYSDDQYCCPNGQLTQKQFCSSDTAAPTVSQTSPPAQHTSCPAPLKSCGEACYSEDQYCCPNGQLTQKAFC